MIEETPRLHNTVVLFAMPKHHIIDKQTKNNPNHGLIIQSISNIQTANNNSYVYYGYFTLIIK